MREIDCPADFRPRGNFFLCYSNSLMDKKYLEGLNEKHVFGGHLCGYVQLLDKFNILEKGLDLDFDVNGGITYNEKECDNLNWIGFDCAHLNDYLPSTEYQYKTDPAFIKITEDSKKLFEKFGLDYDKSPLNQKSYKNINFCVNECKNLVDQILQKDGL